MKSMIQTLWFNHWLYQRVKWVRHFFLCVFLKDKFLFFFSHLYSEKLPEVKLEIVKLEAIEAMEVDAGGVEKEISVGGGVKSMFLS